MTDTGPKGSSPVFAAAVIFVGVALLFFVMPNIMLWLADYSPWLAAGFGALAVLSFFFLFWLRARYQQQKNKSDS
ncbi:hypothetical protein [Agrobacterium sp.]|uniref:hypothetical protein n=1 Tax=Agrobacterium sp. TaxID=361 RepID=UPI0028B014A5|nr:hypothetical protein [Agrobacterium sp.]